MAMQWDLHGITVHGEAETKSIRDQWQETFRSLPVSDNTPDLHVTWHAVQDLPAPPHRSPDFRDDDHVMYWVEPEMHLVCARFPKYGQLEINLDRGVSRVVVLPEAVHVAGVFEDLLAVSLSPHCRRRDLFLIHAFAACRDSRAALLVGPRKSGKTSTGLALLMAGWKLLSNDSPLLRAGGEILHYPGYLSVFDDSLDMLGLSSLCRGKASDEGKRRFAPEDFRADVWKDRANVGAVFLMQRPDGEPTQLEPLTAPQALVELLPHAIEQWDQAMIPAHLNLLRELVERAPTYTLKPGPDVNRMTKAVAVATLEQPSA